MSFLTKFLQRTSRTSPAEALYRKYLPMLRRRCRKLLRDEFLVEDALQNIFGVIFRYQSEFRGGPESELPWLYRITTTECLKIIKQEQRWTSSLDVAFEEGAFAFAQQLSSSSMEERLALVQLLERLPTDESTALVLRYVSGMTQEEISDVMKVSRNQVRLWLSTSLEKVRRMLQ